MARDSNQPERPRVEPEILPPGYQRGPFWQPTVTTRMDGTRVHVWRIGPLATIALLLLIAALVVAVILTVIGVILIWIPIVALIVLAAAIVRFLRW